MIPASYLADGTPVVDLDTGRNKSITVLCAVRFGGRMLRIVRPDMASIRRLTRMAASAMDNEANGLTLLENGVKPLIHPADHQLFVDALDDETERIEVPDLMKLINLAQQYVGGTDRPLPEPLPSASSPTATSTPSTPTLSTSEAPTASTTSTPDVASHGLSTGSLGVVTTTVNPKASAPSSALSEKLSGLYDVPPSQ